MDEIAIREPRPGDAEPLEALITSHFTEGSSYGVDLGIDDPTYHVLVAVEGDAVESAGDAVDGESDRTDAVDGEGDRDGAILGVMALREFTDPTAVADEMYFFDDPDLLPAAERYGHLEMGYVREGATGRGIGSRLLGRLHEAGAERGVDLFLADSWYHGGDDSPEKLFDAHGYETIHRDPIERPAAECPKCEETCTCEGALAVRRVAGDATDAEASRS
ncbi:GNAT family N-acetyltransferase [Halorubrum ezzemoulense]|jgi:GNAT superfamily N-acetyltransferase|uniref:N-acetyltransferase n=1 Tax=Halorubrum ezzemoulense TaxID=337243 RepID=A0A256K5F1_HALEZ|nr:MULTISPECIES: GNAT family N-acetyltransferase [Halorubrum]MDB2225299.1 GNAT family N-acetyltransferase [Halorubrum ezzemoulense]MDB2238660.1 GNAT family N-acetyltransferase [Halorubrum ezzemoulense]MDB2244224.1 GNAT family N-acetyltransferase [Halorubrum ezzemoulense]MDB2247968.1 GNAT family N-acetyltransferase [Halorubrum ezzemoulense]MDB2252330.1 GNAT family N-acetyltransferase [Halorubrum ezzemoulense]